MNSRFFLFLEIFVILGCFVILEIFVNYFVNLDFFVLLEIFVIFEIFVILEMFVILEKDRQTYRQDLPIKASCRGFKKGSVSRSPNFTERNKMQLL